MRLWWLGRPFGQAPSAFRSTGSQFALPFRTDTILSSNQSLTWKVLRSQILLTRSWDESVVARDFLELLVGSGVEFISHSTSNQSILALVAAGYGLTLLVESLIKDFPARCCVPTDF